MMALACLALALAGFAALAVSMPKHHRDLFGGSPRRTRKLALATAGWLFLTASTGSAIARYGVSMGLVLWFGIVTAAAFAVAMSLSYGPRAKSAVVKKRGQRDSRRRPSAFIDQAMKEDR